MISRPLFLNLILTLGDVARNLRGFPKAYKELLVETVSQLVPQN